MIIILYLNEILSNSDDAISRIFKIIEIISDKSFEQFIVNKGPSIKNMILINYYKR